MLRVLFLLAVTFSLTSIGCSGKPDSTTASTHGTAEAKERLVDSSSQAGATATQQVQAVAPEVQQQRFKLQLEQHLQQDEQFQPDKLKEARAHLVKIISEQAALRDMPFPVSIRIIGKLQDHLYEIQDRKTGGAAVLKTTNTVFNSNGLASVVVRSGGTMTLPLEHGAEKTFAVFHETDEDPATATSRYFETKRTVEEVEKTFWVSIVNSNVTPPSSMDEFAELFAVEPDGLALLWDRSIIQRWKNTYLSEKSIRIAADMKIVTKFKWNKFLKTDRIARIFENYNSVERCQSQVGELKKKETASFGQESFITTESLPPGCGTMISFEDDKIVVFESTGLSTDTDFESTSNTISTTLGENWRDDRSPVSTLASDLNNETIDNYRQWNIPSAKTIVALIEFENNERIFLRTVYATGSVYEQLSKSDK